MSLPFSFEVEEMIASPSHIADPAFSLKHACIFVSSLASVRFPFYSANLLYAGTQLTLAEAYHAFQVLRQDKNGAPSGLDMTVENVMNALYLGFAKAGSAGEGAVEEMKFFVIFPHLKKNIRKDKMLLVKLKEDVLEPALEGAWEDIRRIQRTCSPAQNEGYGSDSVPVQRSFPHAAWPKLTTKHGNSDLDHSFVLDDAWYRMKQVVAKDPSLRSLREFLLIGIIRPAPACPTSNSKKIVDRLSLGAWLRPKFVHSAHFKVVSGIPNISRTPPYLGAKVSFGMAQNHCRTPDRMKKRKCVHENTQTSTPKKQKFEISKTVSLAADSSTAIIDLTDQ